MNVFKVELIVIDDKFENRPRGILCKVRENDGLSFVERHFEKPTEYIRSKQQFHKINKRGLVFVFERVDDHTVIFGNDDIVERIEQDCDEEVDKKDHIVLFHEINQKCINT
jgi:hypothetical protein